MAQFIDIHCHLLPGVDDGAQTPEQALALLQMAREDGTAAVVLTPHYRGKYRQNTPAQLCDVFRSLQAICPAGMALYLGNEIAYEKDIGEKMAEEQILSINDGRYILLEFDFSTTCFQAADAVSELLGSGHIPIIAHLERYDAFVKNREFVDILLGLGALIQINADSVLGRWGFAVKRFCHWLLKSRRAHFIASDAHDLNDRPPKLGECFQYIQKKYGSEYAAALFWENAQVVLADRDR